MNNPLLAVFTLTLGFGCSLDSSQTPKPQDAAEVPRAQVAIDSNILQSTADEPASVVELDCNLKCGKDASDEPICCPKGTVACLLKANGERACGKAKPRSRSAALTNMIDEAADPNAIYEAAGPNAVPGCREDGDKSVCINGF